MIVHDTTATIFGGSGFIGTQIIRELADKGVRIKVATRMPERVYDVKHCGTVGQIAPVVCNYNDEQSIADAVAGSDFVINCIGVLYERGKQKFDHVHATIPEMIAKACKKYNVKRFVHISALGCENGTSKYAHSKLAGEKAVQKHYKNTTVLRPSIVFGENDNFFNMFASMMQVLPSFIPMPLIGGGKTRFQPVFVGDVADAVMAGLYHDDVQGKTYQLGGTDVLTFKDVYQKIFDHTGLSQSMISIPFWVGKIEATFLSLLPKPLLTRDQVESLKTDNVVADHALTLHDLNVTPTDLDLVLPTYLERYRTGGRFESLNARTL